MSGQSSESGSPLVVAIDPGRARYGVAVVAAHGATIVRRVGCAPDAADDVLRLVERYQPLAVVLGGGTGGGSLMRALRQRSPGLTIDVVDEAHTSEMARARWLVEHPPRGWRRLVPRGLLTPDTPYDDLVAVILAERWWATHRQDFAT